VWRSIPRGSAGQPGRRASYNPGRRLPEDVR
jgi:hypothetical protein